MEYHRVVELVCPYCNHINHVNTSKLVSFFFDVFVCNCEEGGCDRPFVYQLILHHSVNILSIKGVGPNDNPNK